MKCPDLICGFTTFQDGVNFCPKCGNKLISEDKTDISVLACDGKLEDGSLCKAELDRSQKFCVNCGKKVDHRHFSKELEKCHKCGTIFKDQSHFCAECGAQRHAYPVAGKQDCKIPADSVENSAEKGDHFADVSRRQNNVGKLKIDGDKKFGENMASFNSNTSATSMDHKPPDPRFEVDTNGSTKQNTASGIIDMTAGNAKIKDGTVVVPSDTVHNNIATTRKHAGEEVCKATEENTNSESIDGKSIKVYGTQPQNANECRSAAKQDHSEQEKGGNHADLLVNKPKGEDEVIKKQEPVFGHCLEQERETGSGMLMNQPIDNSRLFTFPTDKGIKEGSNTTLSAVPQNSLGADHKTGEASKSGKNENSSLAASSTAKDTMTREKSGSKGSISAHEQKKKDLKTSKSHENENSNSATASTDTNDLNKNKVSGSEDLRDKKDGLTKSNCNESSKENKNGQQQQQKVSKNSFSQNTSGSSGARASNVTNAGEKCVTVHFHVLVSPDFKFDPKQHKLMIRIGDEKLGDSWKRLDRVMNYEGQAEDLIEMSYEMEIPARLICYGDKGLEYKYCIYKPEKEGESKKGGNPEEKGIYWELYYRNKHSGMRVNRILKLVDKWKDHNIWHQYDGVMMKEATGMMDRFSDWLKGKDYMIKYACRTAKHFCGNINQLGARSNSIQDIIENLEILMRCVWKVYYNDFKCWDNDSDFKKKIGDVLMVKLTERLKVTDDQSSALEMDEKFTTALMVVLIVKNMKLEVTEEVGQVLCRTLLVKPDPEGKVCKEIIIVDKHFENKRKSLKEALVNLGKQVAMRKNVKDSTWLFLMPLIHFLSGVCIPYEKPEFNIGHDGKIPVWWGISHIGEDTLKSFKNSPGSWTVSKTTIIAQLKPLFEMDYYLPRSIITAMELKDLHDSINCEDIPMETCIAAIIYQMRKFKPQMYYSYYLRQHVFLDMSIEEKSIKTILLGLVERLQGYFCTGSELQIQWEMSYKIAYQMLREAKDTDRSVTLYLCAHILIHCLAVYDKTVDKDGEKPVKDNCKNTIRSGTGDLFHWSSVWQFDWNNQLESVLQWWDCILAPVEIQSGRIRDLWNVVVVENLKEKFFEKIHTRDHMEKFVRLYCKKVDQFSPCMQECMSQTAFKAIEEGYSIDYGTFSDHEKKTFGYLLSKLFLDEWNKAVKTGHYDEDVIILRHVLLWQPFCHFLKIKNNDQKTFLLLSHECQNYLHQTESAVQSWIRALLSGSITVGNLDLISKDRHRFSEIAEMLKYDKKHDRDYFRTALDVRNKEVQSFHEQAELVTTFTSLCSHLSVHVKPLYDMLDIQREMEKHKVEEFCIPADVDIVKVSAHFNPESCAFKIPNDVKEILRDLHWCNSSSTFIWLWEKQCSERREECVTMSDVVIQIWKPVKERWDRIAERITDGRIRFVQFENLIGRIYKKDFEKMEKELKCMGICSRVRRIEQLQKYRQLESCVKGAKVILNFQKEYGLSGDFQQIRDIAQHDQDDGEMGSFNDTVMQTCDFLKEITDIKAESLYAFVKCEPLVKWLRESMENSGLKELKVFVDLAFMSAGDEPLSIKKVQCLHAAVTGYAPLIFDLKQTAGYKELLDICRVVWKELAADQNLAKKLIDTNRNLEWLKDVKKAHGSVEVTSLVQADAINANGIYTVGRRAYKDKVTDQTNVLVNSLKLTVSEIEGKRQLQTYSFESLQDLQSRLMLVAEKGNESVDRFTSIFDSIIRVAIVNNKLCASGCVLFKDWTARFLCDRSKPVCTVLDFGLTEGSPTLKTRRSDTEDLGAIIPKIAKFMESCLEEWLQYIKDKRRDYIHLNYFTVDQLVILQKEMVKICTGGKPSILIYPLLSAVKKNCTQEDVIGAITRTKKEIEEKEMTDFNQELEEMDITVAENHDELRETFIRELIDAGYDKSLAIKALNHVEPDQVAEGIVWCMNNCDEDESSATEFEAKYTGQGENSPKETFDGWNWSSTTIESMIASNFQVLQGPKGSDIGTLLEDLKCLWNEFLGCISNSIKDYLSLEHLGMILRNLAARETCRIFRKFPPSFQEGSPNLIICPSADVLNTALSLYVLEKDQSLPEADEILLCTQQTTLDEVDIFWRRAIFGGGKRIHCLVYADCLDFDVSDAAERCLEHYLQETNYTEDAPRYRLVVICGSDNEYRSRIVASLDKYRRPAIPVNLEYLKEYVSKKLQVNEFVPEIKPAACVDFNKSTVRLIKSCRAGVGKTLYKTRREFDLSRLNGNKVEFDSVTIPLQEKVINHHYVIQRLLEHTSEPGKVVSRIFHIDIAHEVQDGVDYLLFNLLVLGCLTDKTGYVWRKSPADLYLIETLPLMVAGNKGQREQHVHHMLNILPDMTCRSPQESLNVYDGNGIPPGLKDHNQLFDEQQFQSSTFQRPFQYLYRLDMGRDLKDIKPERVEGTPQLCLKTLLRHCGVEDPSWAELHHFVWFLNTQLRDFEKSAFVGVVAAEDLPGFAPFVLRFLVQMSRDFSTRSLKMSEESPSCKTESMRINEANVMDESVEPDNDPLEQYQLRRTWESSPHPYLFFNSDHFTFTFLGFYIDRATGNLIDQQTNQVLETRIMQKNLYDSLVRNFVPIQENFNKLPRDKKIEKMCNVMGIDLPHDPDDTYELTTDNVKKIMAIYMRFRCDIPVIIMGETGCGKTRLVKFMCGLQLPPGLENKSQNMILMKVHGGTTNKDIIKKVKEAERIAEQNVKEFGTHMYTVLFFDEANTTESIGLIKEIMCDKSMEGEKLALCQNLKMVAACNPYRKHSEELIKKLEKAGLGYHVDADNTMDKLGRVPMRRLVYRVQPLPQSLLPLVWDFGQLNTEVEDLYIRQMVKRYIRDGHLPNVYNLVEVVSAILTASQDYMRNQRDECSFVSLRDVDRALNVMSWFYAQSQEEHTLFANIDRFVDVDEMFDEDEENSEEEEVEEIINTHVLDDLTRSLVLSLGVCYHACLKTREQYREHIAKYFELPCKLPGGADQIEAEINRCQDVFLENVQLENNIAKNMALKENVFMMVVCIELRIPLFLVGKPGSSKSLAKTIVSDAMQGNASKVSLFKELKQAQMVSFQCSPLSTPDGIVGTFRQCAQFQKDKDLNTFVSIVVLDEVGLAEDSPRMPLKTLHPLLEDGCQGDETPEPYKKVAFIGISNWALDPAKMNRGILVQREVPDLEELENSARGICLTDKNVLSRINPLITPMCMSYLEIFDHASTNMREFFGLRDFYSLVKMVYAFTEKTKQKPTWYEMLHAIKRNFGGLEEEKVDPVGFFKERLSKIIAITKERQPSDPDCSAAGLIEACLFEKNNLLGESRYLLLLTESYGSLTILQQQILARQQDIKAVTIFGSSFRSDQQYTQVCRNINKIKVCMETGNTVVLLNLENLYESLYDALNQYYVYFGGERYVDLGLGTHRVKCPVHKKFRLIVVAEKKTVYEKFPIPLINRLEKHFLNINTMLSLDQQKLAHQLEEWCKRVAAQKSARQQQGQVSVDKIGNVFIGYHEDTCSAVILHLWRSSPDENRDNHEILKKGKSLLLWVATPDAVVRLQESHLPPEEQKELQYIYNKKQRHDSIVEYLQEKLVVEKQKQLFVQVTTHSKLLASFHVKEISKKTEIASERITLLDTLSSFDTEQQFSNKIQQHLKKCVGESLLIIQCDSGDVNANLIACARYCVMDEYQKMREELPAPVHIMIIVQLPNIAGISYTGFQCGLWHSVHIDDLWIEDINLPDIDDMQNKSVSSLITDAVGGPVPMETSEIDVLGNSMESHKGETVLPHGETEEERDPIIADENTHEGHLAIEDVILDFETAGKMPVRSNEQAYQGRILNVKTLIISCTQAALSMLKDKSENCQRTTERVALVLTLFHGSHLEGYDLFLQGMYSVIASLLREKEKNAHRAEQWLFREAARPENIQKAGTFRRSCLQTLESKIAPILAGIIAHLDTNHNLDILDAGPSDWKQKLWLAVLNVPDALSLEYMDLQSPKRHSDLQEIVIKTTGFEGHIFKAKMPFSWLIWQQVTEIMKTSVPVQDRETTDEKHFYAGVFEMTAIGKVLMQVNHRDIAPEIADQYLVDFVHMCYTPLSDQELQVVTKSIKYLYNQKLEETGCSTIHQMIVCIHESYKMLAPRLSYFHAMNTVWPECSATIVNLQRENPDHRMFQEEEFTFSALCMLIEHLEPRKNEIDSQDGRSKWLNRVHTFRPVIEKVLRLHGEDPDLYGTHSYVAVKQAKCLWSRVVVMKLFIEHVCAVETEGKITVKYCMPLWKVLGDSCDLKDLKSMDALEKILKSCNKTAIKEYLGKQEKCQYCEVEIEGLPIILPCGHVFCDQCYQDTIGLGENSCLICMCIIPDTWQVERKTEGKIGEKKLTDYQRRCNSFFMDVVSQLCFYDNTPPSDEVIDKLLKYIFYTSERRRKVQGTNRTKEMTIFDTGLDPNPVFRSFLLQLLMRTSKDLVLQNVEKYLKQADVLLQQRDSKKEYIEFGLLVIHCLEDILSQDISRCVEAGEGTSCLAHARKTIFTDDLGVAKLYGLAEARLGLAIAAKVIARLVRQQGHKRIDTYDRKLIEAAQDLCENKQSDFPGIYLVKYMCRHFGIDIYQAACNSEKRFLMWIRTPEQTEMQRVEVSDRFVLSGEAYFQVREALTKVILGEDISHLHETLQELMTSEGATSIMFPLAVFREITCSNLYPQDQRKVTNKVFAVLEKYVQESEDLADPSKAWLLRFLQNTIGTQFSPHLTIKEGADFRVQGVQCLLIHFLMVILQLDSDKNLCHPLVSLVLSPESYVGTFLPTMPQDDLEEVKEALLAGRAADGSENPVIYRCPNGHPYVIGNPVQAYMHHSAKVLFELSKKLPEVKQCGRPATVGICKDCGATIGGEGYKLRPGNIQHQGEDETQTGHILGPANTRVNGPCAERQMSPLFCASARLMMHMSMYLGAISNTQAVQMLVVPRIQDAEIPEFLWQHILTDLNDLQRGMGKSIDDIFVLLHATLDRMTKTQDKAVVKEETLRWSSKQGRKEWENLFCERYLQPTLNDCDTVIQKGNRTIVEDHRLGADPLLCLLYETATQQEEEDPNHLENIAAVWRYRSPVSLVHLRQNFDSASSVLKNRLKVLDLFLKEERYLQAIRCIPSILKLQKELFQKYNRKLDKSEASQITIGHIIRDGEAGEETHQLVEDFVTAWDICRKTLIHYYVKHLIATFKHLGVIHLRSNPSKMGSLVSEVCPTELGGMRVQRDYCVAITEETPISMLLPGMKEEGLCPYAMLDFLMRKQNDVLDKYIKEMSKAKKRTPNHVAKVLPMEVTSAHLISYDTEMDLLPLILANCNYSFEIGKGTKIEYDYVGLERQIMDRFLFSKSRIDIGHVLQIDLMVYRAEITNGEVFKKLGEKVPQDDLNAAVKAQICSEMKTLPDLCQSLNNLDITISFLKSIGGCPDDSLQYFMEKTLQMKHTVHSQKARQSCLFKHIKSLWLLLALEKSKKMAEHKQPIQNIFESVGQEFQEHLPEDMEIEFRDFMRTISVDKLSELVATLHEFILLKVTVKENRDDEDFDDITSSKLCDWLMAYSDEQDKTTLVQILAGFPATILLKYSIHTWNTAYSMLYEKQTGEQKF